VVHHPREQDGWIGRKKEVDLMVCMNADRAKNVEGLPSGALRHLRRSAELQVVLQRHRSSKSARKARRRSLRRLEAAQVAHEHDYVGIVAVYRHRARRDLIAPKQFKGRRKRSINVAVIDAGSVREGEPSAAEQGRVARMNATGQDHHRRQRRRGVARSSAASRW
jgi:hypothetical protein